MSEKRIKRNAEEVARFLDAEEFAFKGTAPPSVNLESDRKSESSLPLSMKRVRVLDLGAQDDTGDVDKSRRLINAALDAQQGYAPHLSRAIERVRNDPGIKRRWQEGKDLHWSRRYESAVQDLAGFIELVAPGFRLRVITHPEQELAKTKREAQKLDTAYSDRLIVEELEAIEAEVEGRLRKDAIELLIDRTRNTRRPLGGARIAWAIRRHNQRMGEERSA